MPDPILTPLIEFHFNQLRFDLYLQHVDTELFVGRTRFVKLQGAALNTMCGPHGLDIQEVYNQMVECAPWLSAYGVHEFQLVSELGEM